MYRSLTTALTLAVALSCLTSTAAVAQHAELSRATLAASSNALRPNGGLFPRADLVVDEFRATGAPSYAGGGYFTLPVRFTVTNQGQRPAAAFKLAVYAYDNRPPARLVKFTTATGGQKPGWFAWSPPLEPGDRQTFVGRLSLSKSMAGTMFSVYVHADSTASEEFASQKGRVAESSEKNNYSTSVRVRLPHVKGGNGATLGR